MSKTLPGVPETIWVPCSSLNTSSLTLRPPMQQWTFTCIWSPRAKHTFWVYSASSLVGDRIKTWGSRRPRSMLSKDPRVNTHVFPVPDWLCTMTSLFLIIGKIARCWTAEGLSNPYWQTPKVNQLARQNRSLTSQELLVKSKLIEGFDNFDLLRCVDNHLVVI